MIDKLQRFPNQNIEKRPESCTAETNADILGNAFNTPLAADYIYAATHFLQNTSPSFAGADPITAMQACVSFGCLPTNDEPFDITNGNEAYAGDFSRYNTTQRSIAQNLTTKGLKNLYNAQDVINYLYNYKMGISLTVTWYSSFTTPNADGTLPEPKGLTTTHNVAVYGVDRRGFQCKPWLGPDYGDHGYCYISPDLFKRIAVIAAGFDPHSWRWLSLVSIGLEYPYTLSTLLPIISLTK